LVALFWVHRWAVTNNAEGDSEHVRLIESTARVITVLVLLALVGGLVRVRDTAAGDVPLGAVVGALFTVASASASTLLIAMAIEPATDPGDFGRPLFRIAYVGAAVLSVGLGVALVWALVPVSAGRWPRLLAMALSLCLITLAWGYLIVGSSELNQCLVNDEFPLQTRHGCSGQ
jgi:hypothetical protein